MELTIKINMDNAAFDISPWLEVSRVVSQVTKRVPPDEWKPGTSISLYDIDGNKIGVAIFSET